LVSGQVRGLDGEPVPGAVIDVWQSDEDGYYDVQRPASGEHEHRARARLCADARGHFHFRSILAQHYPIPHDGPVGGMLEALGRHPWRPAHLHFMIEAPGYERLITHVFRDGDPYLDSDAVFGVRSSLIADWVRHEPARPPEGLIPECAARRYSSDPAADGTGPREPHYTLDYDFVLNPTGAA
jgi:hydroxyquinol 1,2-dioxygenase